MKTTNRDIVPAAREGRNADAGNFWTEHKRVRYYGYLPARLVKIIEAREDTIDQVIYSYTTPVAWRDAGVWIFPAVSYSMTTSCKHQTHLYGMAQIPGDAGLDEYLQVLQGLAVWEPWQGRYGTYKAA